MIKYRIVQSGCEFGEDCRGKLLKLRTTTACEFHADAILRQYRQGKEFAGYGRALAGLGVVLMLASTFLAWVK